MLFISVLAKILKEYYMRERLMLYIACPLCKNDLKLTVDEKEGEEIKEGKITCSACNRHYRINKFVPRFVAADYDVDTFSFEWNKFYDVQIDILNKTNESKETFLKKTGFHEADVNGKLVLDAGIGAGRYADIVSQWGGEVIGLDLSFAVDAAYKNIGQRDNVHIIQADILSLPLKKNVFDIIYSIGVLHHTPDTKRAFYALLSYLKSGGDIAVYIYSKNLYAKYSDLWRKLTTKIPMKLLYYLTAIAIPAYHIFKMHPVYGNKIYKLFPMSLHKNSRYRWLDTFDWYAPKYQWKHTEEEVLAWFHEAGLVEIQKFDFPICVRGKKP